MVLPSLLARGNELCVLALEYLARFVKGRTLESLTTDMAAFCRQLTDDSQFRWLGPEKGIIHLASGALINAVWDLYARSEKKPLWRLLAELDTEQILSAIEFRYIDDALSREEARTILEQGRATKQDRIDLLQREGYPAYTTSVGWFGFSDEKIRLHPAAMQESLGRRMVAFQAQSWRRSAGRHPTWAFGTRRDWMEQQADGGCKPEVERRGGNPANS